MPRPLRACFAALLALLATGCQSAFFGFVNRDSAQPDVTAVYDPARGLSLDIYRPTGVAPGAPAVSYTHLTLPTKRIV